MAIDFEALKLLVEKKLNGLDASLTYHNAAHTLTDVLPAVEELAKLSGVTDEALLLLKTAVLFHDTGYLEQYKNNESLGVAIAQKYLPGYGFSNQQIQLVNQLILATQMPQSPQTQLQEIMCDADLSSLGRDYFYERGMGLLTELNNHGENINENEWLDIQLKFLHDHSFYTLAAKKCLNRTKDKNILMLQRMKSMKLF